MAIGSPPVGSPPRHLTRPLHRRTPSGLDVVPEDAIMSDPERPGKLPATKSEPELGGISSLSARPLAGDFTDAGSALMGEGPLSPSLSAVPTTPGLSRNPSFTGSSYRDDFSDIDDGSYFPPVERLTMFDFVENLALAQRVEKFQSSLQAQREKLRRQQSRIKDTGVSARDRVVEEWRRRVPTPDEQLAKYKKRMRGSVDRLNQKWNEQTAVTAREKASFIAAVMNIFMSGYFVGAHPEYTPHWYTGQLLYFMPLRFYTYRKKGYHYFLADLCYFVNVLTLLTIWIFPQSKRLFIATYCLAFGNNAVAIIMWRNSLVFHSMDKVVR
jgi:hypothetical protein